MVRTLLKFRNSDSTLDLNDQFSKFFKRGIVDGGEIVPVPAALSVEVTPFKLIGIDGMVVMETSSTTTLNVVAGATNVIVFESQYISNSDPIFGFSVMSMAAYLAAPNIDYLTVFAVIPLAPTDTQVSPTQIDYSSRDVIDPIGRVTMRGTVTSIPSLPASNNRPGDAYTVTSGLGDNPALCVWNGDNWSNITDALIIASLLNAHRNNLFSNEIHLTNDQAAAALGTSGTPSALNPYVTNSDTRIPTQNENDALVGLPATPAPSGSNPFVSAAYALGEPTSKSFGANPGAILAISAGEGPVYVGTGGAGSALQYFQLYHATEPRELVNLAGLEVVTNGLYKDVTLLQPLIPSSEPTVLADNGFYTGTLYTTYSRADLVTPVTMDVPSRLLYGQKESLANISRGALLKPQPSSAQTSAETLQRLQEISGRTFDDPMLAGEDNVSLHNYVVNLRRYANATTAADIVIDSSQFKRLRDVPEFAPDFPSFVNDTQILAGGTAFTSSNTSGDIIAFDSYYSSNPYDADVISIINFSSAVSLVSAQPGHVFQDGAGTRFRILAVNTSGNGSLMIYTEGNDVNTTAGATSGAVYKANNPRAVEISGDHAASLYREFIQIQDVVADSNDFESLPPGGSSVGTGALYSLIGTAILPNQGNAAGAPSGRPVWNVLPKKQGNRVDKRISLIGNWKSDQTNFPNQAVGQVSQGSLGIEFTGRLSELSLITRVQPTMPYNFKVFVDGVFTSSYFTTGPQFSGRTPSTALDTLRAQEALLQTIHFPLALSSTEIHNVRIEVVTDGSTPLYLFGIETFLSAGLIEEAGRSFLETDLVKIDASVINASPRFSRFKGTKVTRYIDRTTKVRNTALRDIFTLSTNTAGTGPGIGNTVYNDAGLALVPTMKVGGVYLYTTIMTAGALTSEYALRRTVAINKTTADITIEAGLPYSMSGPTARVEHVFSVPSRISDGAIICAAPTSTDEEEYNRMSPDDWSVGSDNDVSKLATDATENRVTVLNDGSTSILVYQCQMISSGIEGFSKAIRLNSTSSFVTLQGWGTRIDGIFNGNLGAATVQIEIDGIYIYTLTLRGDGLERHSFFFEGAPQTHVVKISSPSVANRVCLSDVIFHDIKPAVVNGTLLEEYVVNRNSSPNFPSAPSTFYDAAPSIYNTNTATSFAGVRVVDVTKAQANFYEGNVGGSQDWKVFDDFLGNPRFGRYISTDRTNAIMKIDAIGNSFELYIQKNPNGGLANVYIDGVLATSSNFSGLVGAGGFNPSTGQIDYYSVSATYARAAILGLPALYGKHEITIIQSGPSTNPVGTFMNAYAFAETPGTGSAQLRSLDDTSASQVKFQSFKDLRNFITILPDQGGVVATESSSSSATSGLATVPTLDSGLVNLETMPYWFSIANDFAAGADPLASATSPAYCATGFTNPSSYTSSPKSAKLFYDCNPTYTVSGGINVVLSAAPNWAQSSTDLVGAMFRVLSGVDSGKVSRIISATSTSQFVVENTFSNVSGSAGVMQAIHTKDLVQFSVSGLGNDTVASRLAIPLDPALTGFISKDITSILVDSEGSILAGALGAQPLYGSALIAFQANSKGVRADGTTPNTADAAYWSTPASIPSFQTQDLPAVFPPGATNNERLFMRFFPNVTVGSGFVNLLRFNVFFFDDLMSQTYASPKRWAYGYTNNAFASSNCTISTPAGKTRIVFSEAFAFNAFPGTTSSAARVIVDGKDFPRYLASAVLDPTDGYFKEIDPFTIELNDDYSGSAYSVDVRFNEIQRSQIRIGTYSPLLWSMDGYLAVTSTPLDGIRSVFENRTFTQLKIGAFNTGTAGTNTVQLYQNGSLVATGSLPSSNAQGSIYVPVALTANVRDYFELQVTSVGTLSQTLTVELA